MAASIKKFISLFDKRNQSFFRYGIPFLSLLVIGSFGMEKYTKLRYDFTSRSSVSSREFEEFMKTKKVSPEVAFEALHRDETRDDWFNIRGPRPWENSKDVQMAQKEFRDIKIKQSRS